MCQDWHFLPTVKFLSCILFLFLLLISARKSQCMPIFEIEIRQFKILLVFPSSQTDKIIELLLCEQNIEYTFINYILFVCLFILLLNLLSFSLVLVLELENLFWGIFIFPSELGEQLPHFLHLFLKIFIIFLHEWEFLFPAITFI